MTTASSTTETQEARLIEKMRQGDGAAVEEFYNLYRNRIYSLILEEVGRDETIAEDLVQEVFIAALASLDRFRGDSQLYTWLRSIALHKINDFYRHEMRQPESKQSSHNVDLTQLEQIRDNQPVASVQMEDEEARQSVQQALADLPRDYQEVLELKYLKGLPVLTISQIMGRSPKSVEGLLSRARKAMRANLEKNNHEP